MTFDEIVDAVTELDPNLGRDDPGFDVAVLLISSAHVGTDPFALASFTGFNIEWIAQIGERWQASGVWTDEGVAGAGWFDDETGGIEFWLDVNVGLGHLEAAP